MLSKQAFNGLLKTLEEPPEHVKFLFATTEIDKVPITVRSRCQRFDLRRVEAGVLIRHLTSICEREAVAIEPEALALIARAAEGSVRDALSLLDQAIAYGAGKGQIAAASLNAMLGLADRSRIIDLFEAVMRGKMAEALTGLKDLYDRGADPGQILVELAEFVHFLTRLKLVPDSAEDASVTQEERSRGTAFAEVLSMAVLTRAWQILSKGLQEVKESPRPLAAADMVLVRLAFAADLPTPDEALRKLASMAPSGPEPMRQSAPAAPSGKPMAVSAAPRPNLGMAAPAPRAIAQDPAIQAPAIKLSRFEDIVALAAEKRDIQLKLALERDVRLVRFEEGQIEFSLVPGASAALAQTLMRKLQEWTGSRWMVAISREPGAPSLKEQAEAKTLEMMTGVRADPLVRRVLEHFPGAEIVAVRSNEPPPEAQNGTDDAGGEDIAFPDQFYTDEDL